MCVAPIAMKSLPKESEMIIDGKSYPDKDVAELTYELKWRLRGAFIRQYISQGAKLFFAMAFESGRHDDCVKDIRRGKISLDDALAILQSAVDHKLHSKEQAEEFFAVHWRAIEVE